MPSAVQERRVVHPNDLPDELTQHGRCCVIFTAGSTDNDAMQFSQTNTDAEFTTSTGVKRQSGIPVACAAVKPWKPTLERFNIFEDDFVDNADDGCHGNGYNHTNTTTNNHSQPLPPNHHHQTLEQDESFIREWEVTAVAVRRDKAYARRGLVPLCLAELERDLRLRFHSESDDSDDLNTNTSSSSSTSSTRASTPEDKRNTLTLYARTIREINGGYWERRGFAEVAAVKCKKGTLNAVREFHVASLKKMIEV